jgi:hypothetical protein
MRQGRADFRTRVSYRLVPWARPLESLQFSLTSLQFSRQSFRQSHLRHRRGRRLSFLESQVSRLGQKPNQASDKASTTLRLTTRWLLPHSKSRTRRRILRLSVGVQGPSRLPSFSFPPRLSVGTRLQLKDEEGPRKGTRIACA